MTYVILVEPSDEQRQAFARWCLAQDPPIMTTSATGSEVPADLFLDIPDEILDGAYIDGHVFRPVLEGQQPDGDGYAPEQPDVPLVELRLPVPDKTVDQPKPGTRPAAKKTQPRQRRGTTRKADSK